MKTGIEHLCPFCYTRVAAEPPACPECHGAFNHVLCKGKKVCRARTTRCCDRVL